jgi:hypothetical protein
LQAEKEELMNQQLPENAQNVNVAALPTQVAQLNEENQNLRNQVRELRVENEGLANHNTDLITQLFGDFGPPI